MTKMQYTNHETSFDNRSIIIPFDKLFNRQDVVDFNKITLNRRAYYNQTELIANDYSFLLNDNCPLAYDLLGLLFELKIENDNMSLEQFEKRIEEFIDKNKVNLVDKISNLIEDTYTLDLDGNVASNVNVELQITDAINKVFLKGAILIRFIIPLICLFEKNCDEDIEQIKFYRLFTTCFKKFNTTNEPNAAINKLYKLVFSRIIRTKYSDRVIWNYLKNRGLDPATASTEITKNIVLTVIPKTSPNTSIVSFLDVVIREKIKYLFTYNYGLSYKPIRVNSDKELEDKEKIEIHQLKMDEGKHLLNNRSINKECNRIMNTYEITEELIEYIAENINSIQLVILQNYYKRYSINSQDKRTKAILILGLHCKLQEMNMPLLSCVLVSELNTTQKRMSSRKKMVEKIMASDKYIDTLHKYSTILSVLEKNNAIKALIDIRNNYFIFNGEELELPVELFSVEIMRFLSLV